MVTRDFVLIWDENDILAESNVKVERAVIFGIA